MSENMVPMLRLSLTTKMSLVVSLLLAAALCLMTLGVSNYLENQYRATISRQQFGVASAMADEIDGKILSIQSQLVAIAGGITPDIVADPERAREFLTQRPETLVLFDNGLYLFSRKGVMVASNPPEPTLIGKNFSYREYFRVTATTKKPFVSEPFVTTQQHGHPVIAFTAPIFDAGGNLAGILSGSLDLLKDNFLGKLAQAKIGGSGYLYLLNGNGTVIFHTNKTKILRRHVMSGKNRLLDRAMRGFEGTGETRNTSGIGLLSSFKRLKYGGWVLAVNYPVSEAYAALDQAKWYLVEAFLAALSLSLAVTWLFMRRLTSPLARFARHLETITGGDPEPIKVETGDEIETLAVAFNRMVDQVQHQKEAVQAQKTFSENLILNSSIPTFVLDREHRVIIWNRACEELTGVPAATLLGTDRQWTAFYTEKRPVLADLVIDGGQDEFIALYDGHSTRSGSHFHAERWHPSLNGKERFLYFDAAPILNAQGELVAVMETLRDFTQRKRIEEELRKATAAAQAASLAKSEFLANMSHEIRTPMNASIGMLYLLQQTELTDTQKNYLAKAQSASNQLLRVINDILDFSKVEAGRLEIEAVSFSLAKVLRDAVGAASAGVNQKPIELVVSVSPRVPDRLVGDPLRLGQVLVNLTSNAVKFTDAGKVGISVNLVATQEEEVELAFSVWDTGIGIAPEEQTRLFSAFTQGESRTTRRYGGTGLGLAICKQLVELMGGSISVESEKGKGSCFSFQLRLALAGPEEAVAAEAVHEQPDPELSGARVLIVEDHFFDQEFARELLEQKGVMVDVAWNGAEAVDKVTTSGIVYDAVLMDIQMPVLDGVEATRRIRKNASFRSLPIIAMTACALNRERELYIEAGMNDQVNKPVDVTDLYRTLRKWIGQGRVALHPGPQEDFPSLFPPALPGIDLMRALKTLESEPLLLKLLISFGTENAQTIEQLHGALAAEEHQVARRIVHTVKGVSANLGALELSTAALALEGAVAAGMPPVELLQAFEEKMLQVLDSISFLKERAKDDQPPESAADELAGDRENMGEIFRRLKTLLEANNLMALEVWEEARPHLTGPMVDRVAGALAGLDFSSGSRLLDELAEQIEITL